MHKYGYVYILASRPNGTLYTGVTSNIETRIWQHRENMVEGFTKQYNVHRLVYVEPCEHILFAIEREKQLKNWRRVWKIELIEKDNPSWRDLYDDLFL